MGNALAARISADSWLMNFVFIPRSEVLTGGTAFIGCAGPRTWVPKLRVSVQGGTGVL